MYLCALFVAANEETGLVDGTFNHCKHLALERRHGALQQVASSWCDLEEPPHVCRDRPIISFVPKISHHPQLVPDTLVAILSVFRTKRRGRRLRLPYFLALILLVIGCHRSTPDAALETSEYKSASQASIDTLDEARRLVENREFDAARDVLMRFLQEHPEDPEALEMSGDGAIQANDLARATKFFEAAIKASPNPSKQLWFKWAGATINAERPFDTIAILRRAVEHFPDDAKVRQNLASFLARVGLQNEAAVHLQWLVQRKLGSQSILLQLSDFTRPQTDEATCRSALLRNPEDLRPVFSLAQDDVAESNWKDVERALAPVVKQHPEFLPALALYGRALVELDEAESVENWSHTLPPGIEAYSQYWMAAGNWALRQGALDQAARAYWSAARLNENDSEALHALSITLTKLRRTEQAELAARRVENLAALQSHIEKLGAWDFDSQKTIVDLALSLQALGRRWEATNWLMIAHSVSQHPDPRLEPTFRMIRDGLTGSTPWQLPERTVAAKMDLSSLPAIAWRRVAEPPSPPTQQSRERRLRFRNEAPLRSLHHVCDIGETDHHESGLMIFQSGAGGAGVIDFDLDGWPDAYLTVMDGTPCRDDSRPNRLHRNLAGKFHDVTENSLLGDRGFSQGISVGDYNADGWPDVYVANIGKNRLYRNNGDGTFCDVTEQCQLDGSGWTTSVAIADLNGDGHADIYEVGYCRGEQPLSYKCPAPSIGKARSCNPMAFDSESDRVWAGKGDGSFSDATAWLGTHEPGRGFALVVGDLDYQTGLEVYVANDMTGNHFWARATDTREYGLSEQASVRGLAFSHRSNAQASMGIAAADADNDGDIDFLLTHFVDDHNTYYEQYGSGVWSDESRVAGFVDSSKTMLAYGSQWIDADNDGLLEIFIANGDIDDFQFNGRAFRQPAQLLEQVTRGHWQVTQADRLGDYFSKDHLARAVATLDANRDGLTDLIVTHLFDPVALLINQSETAGKQSRFYLRSRSTHRDAIGARVRFHCNERTFEQALLAGNGFQCANEACIVFGTSDADTLEGAEVIWPDGANESLGNLKAGRDYLVVEGLGASPL